MHIKEQFNKLAVLIRSSDKKIFKIGCILILMEILTVSSLLVINKDLFGKLVATYTAGLIGGRMASITAGLEFGLGIVPLTLLLFTFNLIWLFVFYPIATSFYIHVVETGFIESMLNLPKIMAEKQKRKVAKFGLLGLFLFVWLPLPWTGSLVGAIIGFLIGLSTGKIMLVVIPAMLLGIVSWSIGFQYLFVLTESLGKYLTSYIVIFILVLSVFFRFYWRYNLKNDIRETGNVYKKK